MLLDILRQFNWVDIFVIILLLRIGYISAKTGFSAEVFKFLGTIAAIYFSLHYYTIFADFVSGRSSSEKMPLQFWDFICCLFLAIAAYMIFYALRILFSRFIKMEAVPNLDRWGGLALGAARAFLFSGLIIFMLVISTITYFKNKVNDSYLGSRFFKIAPATYSWLWNNITSKFMLGEKFNNTILEVKDAFAQK